MLLLTLLVSATVVAKPVNSGKIAHHQTVSCGNQVYVQSSGGAVLKEKPDARSKTVMQLRNTQYLCVVGNVAESNGWTLVKKVPPATGAGCEDAGAKECLKMADFPSKWQVKKPSGSQCRLTTSFDEGGQLVVTASGVCATGWVKTKAVRFLPINFLTRHKKELKCLKFKNGRINGLLIMLKQTFRNHA